MQKCFGLSVKRGNQKCFFSLVKIGFLKFRVIRRTREKDVFIEAKNWLHEKTTLPLKLADRRFHSAARPQNETAELVPRKAGELRRPRPPIQTAEWDLTRIGHHRRFRNRRSNRRNETERINRPGLNGGWKPPIRTAE